MKFLLSVLIASASLAVSAHALSPQAEAFVRKAGLDPASADVRQADADGMIVTIWQGDERKHSLESLANEGMKNGVKVFVSTRAFIRKLKADYAGTPFPTSGFDGIYLTVEERKLAERKMLE
jgi:hypothetical protein